VRERTVASIILAALVPVGVAVLTDAGVHRHARAATPTTPATEAPATTFVPAPGAPLHQNIYAFDRSLAPEATLARPLVYVPDSDESLLDVINPATRKVVARMRVGRNPQHVVPGWDLRRLYVANDQGNSLTPIDPRTGHRAGPDIAVDDPYNMYFTPDGKSAIVVAEAHHHLDFRDPHTFALQDQVRVPCAGVDHMDFAADGSYLIASCEFSGELLKVDLTKRAIVGVLYVGGRPQDVKVDPAGVIFYVADMDLDGLHEIDGASFTKVGFLPTGPETHGLYTSRDATVMYATNRGGPHAHGSVSVVDFTTRQVVATWPLPGATPDMGGVSADGRELWLSGRRSRDVYVISTASGTLLATIRVGRGPHGLCIWPQPGRFSLGHTGVMR